MRLIWRLIVQYLRPFKFQLLIMFLIAAVVSSTPYAFSFMGKWLVDEALQVTGPPAAAQANTTEPAEIPETKEQTDRGNAAKTETTEIQPAESSDGWSVEWRAKTTGDKLRLLIIFLVITLGMHLLMTALSAVSELIKTRVVHRIVHRMRSRLQRKVISMDMAVFSREQAGQLMTRVLDDSGAIPGNLTNFVINIVTQIVMLILGTVLLLRLNPFMTMIALVMLPFYAVICIIFLPRIAENTMALRDRTATLNGFIMERLSNIVTIKNYVKENSEAEVFGQELEKNLAVSRRQHRLNMMFNTSTTLITGLSTIGVLGVGFWNIRAGRMMLGEVLAFHQVTAQLFVPIAALAGLGNVSQNLKVFAVRIFSILDTPCEIVSPPDAVDPEHVEGDLVFENVSLSYSEDAPAAIYDVNLHLPAGVTACIVGPTGCGKSTLLMVLSRLYDPTEGVIKLDGQDIRRYPITRLRAAIAHELHTGLVFTGTFTDNIAYGLSDTPLDKVRDVARAVGLAEFIESLDHGYNTLIGRGGVELNEEQIARLGLARALILGPAVLTIDDTYAAVDETLEKELRDSVRKWHTDRTIIIATSRLKVCEDADVVVVMSEGKIVQCGTHRELVKLPGLYRRMYMRQTGFAIK